MTTLTEKSSQHHRSWQLDINHRLLLNGPRQILLTKIESLIVKNMLFKKERIISKEELIYSIGREPDRYRGLEMSLSRLQGKFKNFSGGEHLFRAVRNRGYCLTQIIYLGADPSQKKAVTEYQDRYDCQAVKLGKPSYTREGVLAPHPRR